MDRHNGAHWRWLLVLVAASFPYLNGLDNSFHDDDEHAIVRNHHLRNLANIPTFFVDSSTFSAEPGKGMYRPLVQTTLAANYALGQYSPSGYHLVNIGFHALACVGLFFLARLFVPGPTALAVGLLFAVHPIHTQAVNYISSRSELMAACGVVWALWAALSGRNRLGLALFALALLSKSIGFQFIPLLLLVVVGKGIESRFGWRRWAPFLGVGALYLIVISVDGFLPSSLAQDVRPFGTQLATQVKVITLYLKLMTMPVSLSIEHGIVPASGVALEIMLPLLFLLSLVGWSVVALRRDRASFDGAGDGVGIGGVWFFLALAVTTLVPLTVLASEQRLYLAVMGALIAMSALVSHRPLRRGGRVVFTVALCVMVVIVSSRNRLWESELSLWSDAESKAPSSSRVLANLALALHQQGDRARAGDAYRRALQHTPHSARTWSNYASWLEEEGEWGQAEQAYLRAGTSEWGGWRIQLARFYLQNGLLTNAASQLDSAQWNAEDPDLHLYRGRWHQLMGQNQAAQAAYEQALHLHPQHAEAANNLALLSMERGDIAAGRRWLVQALEADSTLAEAKMNLAFLRLKEQGTDALDAYAQLADQDPSRISIHVAWAAEYARRQRWGDAVEVLRRALRANPSDADLLAASGDAYRALQQWPMAVVAYQRACDLRPLDVSLRNQLSAALGAAGRPDDARRQVELVLQQDPENAVARRNLERLKRPFERRDSAREQSP